MTKKKLQGGGRLVMEYQSLETIAQSCLETSRAQTYGAGAIPGAMDYMRKRRVEKDAARVGRGFNFKVFIKQPSG